MGIIISFEGTDGSGKETQSEMIYKKLKDNNKTVRKISFPDYENKSSTLAVMYLNGDFGQKPEDVDSYAASTFYAVDRYASYKTKWKDFYNKEDSIIIADRYIHSNMIYQAVKLDKKKDKDEYLDWVLDFETNKMKIPNANYVIFLNMPPFASKKLRENRLNKINGNERQDIHESNDEFLKKSYENAIYIAKKYNFIIIDCVKNDTILSKEEIGEMVWDKIKKLI